MVSLRKQKRLAVYSCQALLPEVRRKGAALDIQIRIVCELVQYELSMSDQPLTHLSNLDHPVTSKQPPSGELTFVDKNTGESLPSFASNAVTSEKESLHARA